jgi:CheY-like chemotaxis protein
VADRVIVRHKSVLVIDDDPAIRISLAELLTDRGYETLTECDGASALDLLNSLMGCSKEVPSVMLVDIAMPHLDGYEFVAALRCRPEVPAVRLILMSACAPLALPPGAHGFVAKPFNVERLVSTIRPA